MPANPLVTKAALPYDAGTPLETLLGTPDVAGAGPFPYRDMILPFNPSAEDVFAEAAAGGA
jgi:hypothetical protein